MIIGISSDGIVFLLVSARHCNVGGGFTMSGVSDM